MRSDGHPDPDRSVNLDSNPGSLLATKVQGSGALGVGDGINSLNAPKLYSGSWTLSICNLTLVPKRHALGIERERPNVGDCRLAGRAGWAMNAEGDRRTRS